MTTGRTLGVAAGTDSDAIHDNTSAEISVVAEKTSPVSADLLLIEDSASANAKKRVQIGNLPSGGITFGGDGSLGNVTISSNTSLSGVQNYGDLIILTGVNLSPVAGSLLTIRCTGNLDIQGTGAINADGRGHTATNGTIGVTGQRTNSGVNMADATTASAPSASSDLLCSFGGPGGAGGAGGHRGPFSGTSSGGGGTGAGGASDLPGAAGSVGSAGAEQFHSATIGAGNPATSSGDASNSSRLIFLLGNWVGGGIIVRDPLALQFIVGGAGTGGGGGGGGHDSVGFTTDFGRNGAAGVIASQTTFVGGDGGNGVSGTVESSASAFSYGGGGGGAGGHGGGAVQLEIAGNVTIASGARISADGGDGGNGGNGGQNNTSAAGSAGGGAGGGGGGGGGMIHLLYQGTATNVDSSHIHADAGVGGTKGTGGDYAGQTSDGGGGGDAGDGSPGLVLFSLVA